ncbi:MAG: 30S ribosomal protein S15 [Flavobacteriales bacterium]|jgi:small subunit ribosomal protein S15|nr:30S ribosomal protein S15 [Flavobacteriales bacterium]|tara:strand:- start:520 stop:789 length:270 start_codon:yes stop_codon:yes gene_type:complete
MYLDTKKKKTIFKKYGKSEADTGNSESQIAIFTERINHLTQYLTENKKDNNTKRSLVLLVGKRRRMLDYLKKKDIERYRKVIKLLNLRK